MILDSSAWIEFFNRNNQGERVKEVLDGGNCNTCITSIAEVTNHAVKKGIDANPLIDKIEQLSEVIDMDRDIATMAGRINFERKKQVKKWGMLDSFVLASALKYDQKILTTDSDFKDLENAEVL
jgi:predicted nucleic acid-binding protein